MERPCACLDLDSGIFDRDVSPVKLTRPQKRRKRLQVHAAQKAVAKARGMPADELEFQTIVLNQLFQINGRLQAIEGCLLPYCSNCNWHADPCSIQSPSAFPPPCPTSKLLTKIKPQGLQNSLKMR